MPWTGRRPPSSSGPARKASDGREGHDQHRRRRRRRAPEPARQAQRPRPGPDGRPGRGRRASARRPVGPCRGAVGRGPGVLRRTRLSAPSSRWRRRRADRPATRRRRRRHAASWPPTAARPTSARRRRGSGGGCRCRSSRPSRGPCLGGGLQIALGADIRIVAPDAKLSVLEMRWGLIPDMTGTWILPRLVGDDVARELTYTGRMLSGEEAAAIGLCTRVADDPHAEAMALAARDRRQVARRGPSGQAPARRVDGAGPHGGRAVPRRAHDHGAR